MNCVSFSSLQQQLHHVLKGACHERSDVRMDALKALHRLLRSNRVSAVSSYLQYDQIVQCIFNITCSVSTGRVGEVHGRK